MQYNYTKERFSAGALICVEVPSVLNFKGEIGTSIGLVNNLELSVIRKCTNEIEPCFNTINDLIDEV